jgi:hypothetical protein
VLKVMLVFFTVLVLLPQSMLACGRRHFRTCRNSLRACEWERVAVSSNDAHGPAIDDLVSRYFNELFQATKKDLTTVKSELASRARRVRPLRPMVQEFTRLESVLLKKVSRMQQVTFAVEEPEGTAENLEQELHTLILEVEDCVNPMNDLGKRADKIIEDYDKSHRAARPRHFRLRACRVRGIRR